MLIRIEMPWLMFERTEMQHHDVSQLVGHALRGIEVTDIVDAHGITVRNHSGFLTQFTQCGVKHILALVHKTRGQPIGEHVRTSTIFTFDKVSVIGHVMHEHYYARRVAQHLTADFMFFAAFVGQCNTHIVHMEDAAGIHGFTAHHLGGHIHVDTVRSSVQLMVKPALELFPLAFAKHASPSQTFSIPYCSGSVLTGGDGQRPWVSRVAEPFNLGTRTCRPFDGNRHILKRIIEPHGFDGSMRCVDEIRTHMPITALPLPEGNALTAHSCLVTRLFNGISHRMMP